MKKKPISRRIFATIICGLIVISSLFTAALPAMAADVTVRMQDTNWQRAAVNFWNGGHVKNGNWEVIYSSDGNDLFCVQPGEEISTGDEFDVNTYINTLVTPSLSMGSVPDLIGRIVQYVDTGTYGRGTEGESGKAQYFAAQLLIWEVTQGERNIAFDYISPPAGVGRVMDCVNNSSLSTTRKDNIRSHYNRIVNSVQNHLRIPSFTRRSLNSATAHKLTGTPLSIVLNDTNGVLSNYNFSSSNSSVHFSKSGNTLTITADSMFSGTLDINVTSVNKQRKGVLCYGNGKGDPQDVIKAGDSIDDPVRAFLKIEVGTGNLAIVKTTQHNGGTVSGFQFEVRNSANTLLGTYTSSSDGKINIPNIQAGTYSVKEINLSSDFVTPTPNPKSVTVIAGQTATVSFDNVRKRGVINVRKSNANPTMGDYSLAGAEFSVKNSSGAVVDTIVTNAAGEGQSKALALGSYTIFESKAPYGYVVDKEVYSRTLTGTQGTAEIVYCPEISVAEQPQVGTIKISKYDRDTADRPQGDSVLTGAVFEIYTTSNVLVDTLYCDTATSVTSKELPLGNYYVKEKTPPVGYTLDESKHAVTIEYQGQDVSVVRKNAEIKNKVIEGEIAIVKHLEDPDEDVDPSNPQVEQPLDGAVFQVFLKSAGSYENALPTERALLVTDEDGYAQAKLPYGLYVVNEVSAAGLDVKLVEPFDVFVAAEGKVYRYILSNPWFKSLVKIVKVDAETGKTIPIAGTSFKVWDVAADDWVTQSFNYPVPTVIDTYETAPDGTLVMPEALKSGEYLLYEQSAPHGYVLSKEPIAFTIHSSQDDPEIIGVTFENNPQKGIIRVYKQGEMLIGADKNNKPIYENRYLAGAVFNVVAAEDIITHDGTLRYKKGEVVDTITTDKEGLAESKALYLGKYELVETKAPFGFVLDKTPHGVELAYAGQEVEITSTQVGIFNERQRVKITLNKVLEGGGDYSAVTFGLYARTDILTADGKVAIPAGSLIEVISVDENGLGEVVTDLPFGSFYIKELTTSNKHLLDKGEYDISFEYAGEGIAIVELAVNNGNAIINHLVPVPHTPIPKTGENNYIGVVIGLAAICIGGIIALTILKKKGR